MYGPELYDPAAFGAHAQYFEDATEGAARAIHAANNDTVVLYYLFVRFSLNVKESPFWNAIEPQMIVKSILKCLRSNFYQNHK